MKNVFKRLVAMFFVACMLAGSVGTFSQLAYSAGESNKVQSADTSSIDGLIDSSTEAISSTVDRIGKLAEAICAIVIIISLIVLMFSRSQQKTSLTIGSIATAGIALLGIWAVRSGWATGFIENIATKYFGG